MRGVGQSGRDVVVLQEIEAKFCFPSTTELIYIVEDSAWKFSPVWSCVHIWKDWDRDQSLWIEKPQKTRLNQCELVQCGLLTVDDRPRPVTVLTSQ